MAPLCLAQTSKDGDPKTDSLKSSNRRHRHEAESTYWGELIKAPPGCHIRTPTSIPTTRRSIPQMACQRWPRQSTPATMRTQLTANRDHWDLGGIICVMIRREHIQCSNATDTFLCHQPRFARFFSCCPLSGCSPINENESSREKRVTDTRCAFTHIAAGDVPCTRCGNNEMGKEDKRAEREESTTSTTTKKIKAAQ